MPPPQMSFALSFFMLIIIPSMLVTIFIICYNYREKKHKNWCTSFLKDCNFVITGFIKRSNGQYQFKYKMPSSCHQYFLIIDENGDECKMECNNNNDWDDYTTDHIYNYNPRCHDEMIVKDENGLYFLKIVLKQFKKGNEMYIHNINR